MTPTKEQIQWYDKLSYRPWNGKTTVVTAFDDKFFYDVEEFTDWCYENEIDPGSIPLVHADPIYMREVEEDYWEDCFAEDYTFPKDIKEKLDALNKAIREYGKPTAYQPSNVKTSYVERYLEKDKSF